MSGIDAQRPVQQVKVSTDFGRNRLDTSRAANLDRSREVAQHADVFDHVILAAAMLFQQLRASLGIQNSGLPQLRAQIKRPRRKLLRTLDFLDFQLLKTDEHRQLPSLSVSRCRLTREPTAQNTTKRAKPKDKKNVQRVSTDSQNANRTVGGSRWVGGRRKANSECHDAGRNRTE